MPSLIGTFEALRARAEALGPRTVVVAGADSATALMAMDAAQRAGIATPVFVEEEGAGRRLAERLGLEALLGARFEPATGDVADRAAALVAAGEADILLKGSLRTDLLLRAVLDRRHGLRGERLLSDVLLYEDHLAGAARLVGVTDGGINVAPDLDQLHAITANAIDVFHRLGFERPRVALLSATEAVSDAVPSTRAARAIAELAAAAARQGSGAALGRAEVAGPLALDNALLESAARAKGIDSPVAGHADILVLPSIEAGNVLGKAVKYLGGSITAHVVVGARVPVLIPSRVESAEDKLMSIALGVVVAAAGGAP